MFQLVLLCVLDIATALFVFLSEFVFYRFILWYLRDAVIRDYDPSFLVMSFIFYAFTK